MPQDKVANEVALLSNIIYSDDNKELLLTVLPQLRTDDFIDPRNRAIYDAILNLNKKNITPDFTNVITELKNQKTYEEAGGAEYLDSIFVDSSTVSALQDYINATLDASLLRRFLGKIDAIRMNATTKPIANVSDFIGEAEKDLLELTHKRRSEGIKNMEEVSDNIMIKLIKQTKEFQEKGIQPNGVTGEPTGYSVLDYYTKGWHKGDMIIVGARPSVGKTAFALNLLYQVAKRGTPVIFFSLEMSAESIGMRLLSMTSGLTTTEIDSLTYLSSSKADQVLIEQREPEDLAKRNKLQEGFRQLRKINFYIDDNPGSKMLDIISKCRKQINSIGDVGLIAIDYLGLITSDHRSENRTQEVAEISRQLKQMARELNVPVLALSQLSRESAQRGKSHTPQMSDIRDSGAIEQDADMILMLYRKDYFNDEGDKKDEDSQGQNQYQKTNNAMSNVTVKVVKQRNGPTGDIEFMFDKEHCEFTLAANDNFCD